MALAFIKSVGTVDIGTGGGDEGVTLTCTQTHAVGNLLVLGVVINADRVIDSLTDSKLNTWAVNVTTPFIGPSGATKAYIASSVLTTQLVNTDTIRISFDAFGGVGAYAAEFSGNQTASVLDKIASQADAAGTSHSSSTTAVTTVSDELLVGVHALVSGGASWTPDVGWNELHDAVLAFPNRGLVMQYKIVSATGAYASTGTSSASVEATQGIATYKGQSTSAYLPPLFIGRGSA